MPLITAITPHARRAGRFDVELEGDETLTLSDEAVVRLGLRAGARLDDASLDAVRRCSVEVHTLDRALDMLAFRSRAARELRRSLIRKGEPAEAVDAVIPRLIAAGLLDDAQYARQLARSKLTGKGFSRRRLATELFKRGVERDVAEEAIADVVREEEVDEQAMLEAVARRQVGRLAALDALSRRRRLYAFLARRGYASDDIRRVLRRVLGDEGPSPAE
ncbi:MAG TPA: regulatory protein RecX [Gemmatimonadaceae bacterium]|nr:regulatory protein RecX [Gemmatimonadaceae bacterium]